jgi:hypothetical protein
MLQLPSLFPREQRGLEVKVSGGIPPLILVTSWCAWGQLSFALQPDLQHFEYKEQSIRFALCLQATGILLRLPGARQRLHLLQA